MNAVAACRYLCWRYAKQRASSLLNTGHLKCRVGQEQVDPNLPPQAPPTHHIEYQATPQQFAMSGNVMLDSSAIPGSWAAQPTQTFPSNVLAGAGFCAPQPPQFAPVGRYPGLFRSLSQVLHGPPAPAPMSLPMQQSGATASNTQDTAQNVAERAEMTDRVRVDDGAAGSLPKFVRGMMLQMPAPGPFSANDITWSKIQDNGKSAWAAAFEEKRYTDFQQGEAQRGCCRINCTAAQGKTAGLLTNDKACCCYATERHKARRQRQQAAPSDAPQPVKEGATARRGALQNGMDLHSDCQYRFTVKQYCKAPGTVIIKFPAGDEAAVSDCKAQQHLSSSGMPAHSGDHRHALTHHPDVEEIVLAKLRAGTKPSIIKEGVHHLHVLIS